MNEQQIILEAERMLTEKNEIFIYPLLHEYPYRNRADRSDVPHSGLDCRTESGKCVIAP